MLVMLLWFSILFGGSLEYKTSVNEFCNIDPKNTPCRHSCLRSKSCGYTETKFRSLTDEERIFIVNKHNTLRDETVRGSHIIFLAMTMKPMKIVSYDKECEFLAGCHIKQCIFVNDEVRMSLDDGSMGQIMYRRMVKDDKADKLDVNFLAEAFDMWINRKKPKHVEIVGNILQLAWVHTTHVGCAMMYYRHKPNKFYYSVVCNYKPELPIDKNLSYELRYHVCTKRNKIYKRLCGFVRPLEEDDFTPPLRLDTAFACVPIYALVAICASTIMILYLV